MGDYARVTRTIWSDEDFCDLPPDSQWLYFYLMTSPTLNYAGVADWRPARIAAHTRGMTPVGVEVASVELEQCLFTIVDRNTEEVALRTYVRHDGLMGVWNMAAAMAKAYNAVTSRVLRGVIAHELRNLHSDEPDHKGWARPEVREILKKEPVTPSDALFLLPRWTGENALNAPTNAPSNAPTKGATIAPSIGGLIAGGIAGASLLTPTPSPNSHTPKTRSSVPYLSTDARENDEQQP